MGWFDCRWEGQSLAYCALQPSKRDPILAGIRYIYETDREFLTLNTVDFNPMHLVDKTIVGVHPVGLLIPVVDQL